MISFFIILSLAEWLSNRIFRAGLIGQIIVGLIYGLPIGNIMPLDWQETFVSLGYIGLILIIFEGTLRAGILSPWLRMWPDKKFCQVALLFDLISSRRIFC